MSKPHWGHTARGDLSGRGRSGAGLCSGVLWHRLRASPGGGIRRGTEITYLLVFKEEKYGCVQFGIDP